MRKVGPSGFEWSAIASTVLLALPPSVVWQRPAAQNEPYAQELRLGAPLVEVTYTVTDRRGRPVTGLTKGDFELYQDGRKQEITFFQPPQTNGTEAAPMLLGLLIDISGSMSGSTFDVRNAAREFIKKLPFGTKVAILSFDERLKVIENFTADRSLIDRAIAKVTVGFGMTHIYWSVAQAIGLFDAIVPPGQLGWRKTLIVISDGLDSEILPKERTAIDLALRSNVKIYTVGIPGQVGRLLTPREFSGLAQATGGKHFTLMTSMGLEDALGQIAEAINNQYLIAYMPREADLDGKFHRIEVKAKLKGFKIESARPGFQSLTDTQYRRKLALVEASQQASQERLKLLQRALSIPPTENQIAGTLTLERADRSDQDQYFIPFVLTLQYDSLEPQKVDGAYLSTFDCLVRLESLRSSQVRERRDQFSVHVSEKKMQKSAFGFRSTLHVRAGSYRLKVAIIEVNTGKTAVFETRFEIPE